MIQHWYKIPQKTVDAAVKEGFQLVPTEIALRAHNGTDMDDAMEAGSLKAVTNFRHRLIASTICGINLSPGRERESRQVVHSGVEDANLLPANIWARMPGPIMTMLMKAFSTINDGNSDDIEDFEKSHTVVAA